MAFRKIPNKHTVANTPEELLNDLKTRKIKGLIAHQADILRAYHEQHDKESDIALQLPTGSYTQFKKYFSKMNNEDRLSKRGINLIFFLFRIFTKENKLI